MRTSPEPLPEVLAEARRLVDLAGARQLAVRLLGGAGVALHSHGAIPLSLQRAYKDLDFVVSRKSALAWSGLLEGHGYTADTRFNKIHGSQRLLHFDQAHARQLDTFVGAFEMCHRLDLERRIELPGTSLAPVDLLLTKLQIVEINDKDLIDVMLLLSDHPLDSNDPEAIDRDRLAKLVGDDWGWYRTLSDNLEKVDSRLHQVDMTDALRARIFERIRAIQDVLRTAPRTMRWRARAAVGRRVPWYDLPEEVGTDL